jgi:2-dehydropantoate 2-reductase
VNVVVVGGGAVGSLLAWALRRGDASVSLVHRRHVGPPTTQSVEVEDRRGDAEAVTLTVAAKPDDLAAEPDVIVFAVKMYDLRSAVQSCEVWPSVPSVTVQNGIGAELLVTRARPRGGVVAASLTASVEATDDARWRRRTTGGLGLADVDGRPSGLTAELADVLTAGGITARVFDDAMAMKWSKLVGNLAANAIAALLDYDPGRIYRHPRLFLLERAQLLEALAVMAKLGLRPVALPGADIRLLARAAALPPWLGRPILAPIMARARGGKDPSLRLRAGMAGERSRSEVDWLNGAVARTGEMRGVATPVNRRLTHLVNEVLADPTRQAWFRQRPSRLIEAVSH